VLDQECFRNQWQRSGTRSKNGSTSRASGGQVRYFARGVMGAVNSRVALAKTQAVHDVKLRAL